MGLTLRMQNGLVLLGFQIEFSTGALNHIRYGFFEEISPRQASSVEAQIWNCLLDYSHSVLQNLCCWMNSQYHWPTLWLQSPKIETATSSYRPVSIHQLLHDSGNIIHVPSLGVHGLAFN